MAQARVGRDGSRLDARDGMLRCRPGLYHSPHRHGRGASEDVLEQILLRFHYFDPALLRIVQLDLAHHLGLVAVPEQKCREAVFPRDVEYL
jgi:hypothetical protein